MSQRLCRVINFSRPVNDSAFKAWVCGYCTCTASFPSVNIMFYEALAVLHQCARRRRYIMTGHIIYHYLLDKNGGCRCMRLPTRVRPNVNKQIWTDPSRCSVELPTQDTRKIELRARYYTGEQYERTEFSSAYTGLNFGRQTDEKSPSTRQQQYL